MACSTIHCIRDTQTTQKLGSSSTLAACTLYMPRKLFARRKHAHAQRHKARQGIGDHSRLKDLLCEQRLSNAPSSELTHACRPTDRTGTTVSAELRDREHATNLRTHASMLACASGVAWARKRATSGPSIGGGAATHFLGRAVFKFGEQCCTENSPLKNLGSREIMGRSPYEGVRKSASRTR